MNAIDLIKKYKNILTLCLAVLVIYIGMQVEMERAGEKNAEAAYSIGHSLRFRDSSSAYMEKTFASSTSNRRFTLSFWVKRSKFLDESDLFSANNTGAASIYFHATYDTLYLVDNLSGLSKSTTQVFRDPSAWMHVVVATDSTLASSSLRDRLYINGEEVTAWTLNTPSTQNADYYLASNVVHRINSYNGSGGMSDIYLSDYYYVDGQQLAPTSFGETSTTTGTWIPKAYSGTYGNNGFHLDFTDGSSTTTLGYDSAGSNDWTTYGLSASSTVSAYDWMTDTPTKNFATLNPLDKYASNITLSNGNLRAAFSTNYVAARSTMFVSSGSWYVECTAEDVTDNGYCGVATSTEPLTSGAGAVGTTAGWGLRWDANSHETYHNGTYASSYSGTPADGDVYMMAFNMDTGKIWWGRNGTWFASGDPENDMSEAYSSLSGEVSVMVGGGTSGALSVNFGQQPFKYTPPAGFNTLSTNNLPEPTILKPSDHFDAVAYTGNGGYQMPLGNLYSNPTPSYDIGHSLRFRASNSAYLANIFGSTGSTTKWTWSGWVKRGKLGTGVDLLSAKLTGGSYPNTAIAFDNSDAIRIWSYTGSSFKINKYTTQLFRDPTRWYHILVAVDSADPTAEDRVKVYVDGIRVTSFSTNTNPSQNDTFDINVSGNNHVIGGWGAGSYGYFDGGLSNIHFIDGRALGPTYFGEADATTGAWVPKAYSGSYGTNGFFLDFTDGTSTTTLGYDSAGSNDWTLTGFSASSTLSTYDWMLDTPTENYATLNPLDTSGTSALVDGNLQIQTTASGRKGTFFVSSGKWAWEIEFSSTMSGVAGVGVCDSLTNINTWSGSDFILYRADGGKQVNGSYGGAYGASYTNGDVLRVEYNADANSIEFFKQTGGTGSFASQGSLAVIAGPHTPCLAVGATGIMIANFGQRPFKSTPTSGFGPLKSTNLSAPTTFDPGLVWIKNRTTSATNHGLYDITRGSTVALRSNTNDVETAVSGGLVGFNKGGFSIGSDATVNTSGSNYIAWNWKAGSIPVQNNDGSSTSTVSANTTAGFSIVNYRGTGSTATVGHGLNAIPSMVMIKNKDASPVEGWRVYHKNGNASPGGGSIYLHLTSAWTSDSTDWNSTAPTTTVFTVGSSGGTNKNATNLVAYVFSEVAGFSKFGSYTGNGSADGSFVYTGFKPRWIMIKRSDAGAEHWNIFDTERAGYNPSNYLIYGNLGNADDTTTGRIDFLSNGFKARDTGSGYNALNSTYVYAAFAEESFKYSTAGATTVPDDAQLWFGMDF